MDCRPDGLKKRSTEMIQLPKGFRFAGIHCDVKPNTTKKDIALMVSDREAVGAGVYTTNLVCGAPVQIDRQRTPGKGFRAVVVNSGVANACTGNEGLCNAEQMAQWAAQTVGANGEQALVMSTGVIGIQLPMDRIERGIALAGSELSASEEAFHNAAFAMMTTDTKEKVVSKSFVNSNGKTITLAGMCKGAAMIGPNMATMLCLIMTDATIEPQDAQGLLRHCVNETFNSISVEGHTSTSDTVLLLANGASDPQPLSEEDQNQFADILLVICSELARMIPNDGEGISHLITVNVYGCAQKEDALKIARTIANDVLVKTAICGADPNWGRIVSAAGRAQVPFDPQKVSLKINGYELYRDGAPVDFDKPTVTEAIRSERETVFQLYFQEGDEGARFWTSDLTPEYVHMNADYTT